MEEKRGYEYDVFISYPHEPHHLEWVKEIFLGAFKLCLTNSLGRTADVFIDTSISPGDMWRVTLREALARSRIFVPIWSIQYFESEYCRGECAIMLHRGERLGYLTQEKRGGLIVPVRFMDHKGYPDIARDFHQQDFRMYSSARKGSGKAMKLLRAIESWVEDVARRVEAAPQWDPAWLSSEWLEEPVSRYEASRTLWPPRKICHLESMGWDEGGDDEEDDG